MLKEFWMRAGDGRKKFTDKFDRRYLTIAYKFQYKCELADLIQFLLELPTSDDRYATIYRQARIIVNSV